MDLRTQEASSRLTRLQELELWGRALAEKEKSQGLSGSGEKLESGVKNKFSDPTQEQEG